MEGLHVAVEDAVDADLYKGSLLKLMCVNDAIFLGDRKRENIVNLIDILHYFDMVLDFGLCYKSLIVTAQKFR